MPGAGTPRPYPAATDQHSTAILTSRLLVWRRGWGWVLERDQKSTTLTAHAKRRSQNAHHMRQCISQPPPDHNSRVAMLPRAAAAFACATGAPPNVSHPRPHTAHPPRPPAPGSSPLHQPLSCYKLPLRKATLPTHQSGILPAGRGPPSGLSPCQAPAPVHPLTAARHLYLRAQCYPSHARTWHTLPALPCISNSAAFRHI